MCPIKVIFYNERLKSSDSEAGTGMTILKSRLQQITPELVGHRDGLTRRPLALALIEHK
jgi:hypothetical protein